LKEEAPDDSPIRKDLELIVEQTDRCKGIVGGLLNFARKNQVNLEETNIRKFVKHSFESVLKPENIRIEFHDDLNNSLIHIDRDQMMQVLTNLEKNAVEAMSDGGILTVSLSENKYSIEINVSDTGVGIPKENMDKLFTPFFTTKKNRRGNRSWITTDLWYC